MGMLYPKRNLFLELFVISGFIEVCAATCPSALSKCQCSTTTGSVTCVGTRYDMNSSSAALKAIPLGVKSITFTGNDVIELKRNVFGEEQREELRHVNLSNNNITQIHGQTFHHVRNVLDLDLSNNDWLVDSNHSRVFTNFFNLKVLRMDNTFMEKYNSTHHTVALAYVFAAGGLSQLEELYLSNNEIAYYGAYLFNTTASLRKLILSHNVITKPVFEANHFKRLEELYLDNNALMTPGSDFLKNLDILTKNHLLKIVNISQNPFLCDCDLIYFQNWLNKTQTNIVDKEKLTCDWPKELSGRTILTLKPEEMVCENPTDYNRVLRPIYIVIVVIFCMLAVLFIAIIVMNRAAICVQIRRWTGSARLSLARTYGRFDYSSVNI